MTLIKPTLDNQAYAAATDRPGDLALVGLAIAARETSLDGIARGVPELTMQSYGAPHVALIEAHALITAQLLYRANALPDALLLKMIEAVGIPRREASAAQVDVYVDNPTAAAVTWVQGAVVGGVRVLFEVARTVTVPAGAVQFGPVPLLSVLRGPIGNVQANLNGWTVITPVPLKNLTNPQPAQGGAEAETDAEYAGRGGQLISGRGVANRAADAEALALRVPGVERVQALEHTYLTNGARWGYFPWGRANLGPGRINERREGMMSLMVRAYGGGYLPSELQSSLEATLAPLRPYAGLLQVVSPEEIKVDVTVQVRSTGLVSSGALLTAVRTAINSFLSGSAWVWGAPFRRGELEAVISRVPGVAEVAYLATYPQGAEGDLWTADAADGNGPQVTPRFPNVLFIAGQTNAGIV